MPACMGELLFLGIGLHDDTDLPLKNLEAARTCDALFLDTYTSVLPGLDLGRLSAAVGREGRPGGRAEGGEGAPPLLAPAAAGRAGLLVPGDPMTATTHIDLRLRAHARGIATKVYPGASILTAAAGLLGLQAYKFGPV